MSIRFMKEMLAQDLVCKETLNQILGAILAETSFLAESDKRVCDI